MRNKNIFLIIFCLIFFLMIISAVYEIGIFDSIYNYIIDVKFREKTMNLYNNYNYIDCLLRTVLEKWNDFEWNFDYIIIWSTNIFQIVLPFFTILGSVLWTQQKKEINKRDIYVASLKMSASIFLAYAVFYILIIIICHGNYSDYITRELFLDLLGDSFYSDHIYLYYFLDGVVRFLFAPFIYISSGMYLSASFKNKIWLHYYVVILYFYLSMISILLSYIIDSTFIYLNPMSIILFGSYTYVSTPLLLLVNIIPLKVSQYIYTKKQVKYEN